MQKLSVAIGDERPDAGHNGYAHVLDRFLEKAMQGVAYGDKTGGFIAAAWKNSQANYQANGALKGTVAAETGYTTRFLEACNGFDRVAVAAETKKY